MSVSACSIDRKPMHTIVAFWYRAATDLLGTKITALRETALYEFAPVDARFIDRKKARAMVYELRTLPLK